MTTSTNTRMSRLTATLTHLISRAFHLYPLFLIGYSIVVFAVWQIWVAILPFIVGVVLFFRGELGMLYVMGRLYWITKEGTRRFSIGIASMHQTYEPWRKGKGIYISLFKRTFQIGLCKEQRLSEEEGILSAVEGRYLDVSPKEIGDWGAQKAS